MTSRRQPASQAQIRANPQAQTATNKRAVRMVLERRIRCPPARLSSGVAPHRSLGHEVPLSCCVCIHRARAWLRAVAETSAMWRMFSGIGPAKIAMWRSASRWSRPTHPAAGCSAAKVAGRLALAIPDSRSRAGWISCGPSTSSCPRPSTTDFLPDPPPSLGGQLGPRRATGLGEDVRESGSARSEMNTRSPPEDGAPLLRALSSHVGRRPPTETSW